MSQAERKLVTRRRIETLRPIPGADRIEVARVDGWDVIVKRGEFAVAAQLNVALWEPPIPTELSGPVCGPIPSFIRKSDQERVQNLPNIIAESDGVTFEVTVKLDGTSMTVFHNAGTIGVCGRRFLFTSDNTNSLCGTARALAIPEQLTRLDRNIAVQGELMGPKIQGNQERLSTHQFFVFDVWDIDKQRLMAARERVDLVSELGLQHAPVLHTEFRIPRTWTVDDVLDMADGPSFTPSVAREGVVFKAVDGTMSFKVISNAWLVQQGG